MKFVADRIRIVLAIFIIVFIAGCTSTQIDKLLKASPAVSEFLQQYPDAKINTILVSKETVASQLENIQKDCGPDFEADKYYKTIISDPQSGQKLTAWISEKDYKVVCFVKEKINENIASTSTTNTQSNFISTTMYNISNPTTTTVSPAPQFTSTTQNQTQTTTTSQTIIIVNKTKQVSLDGICDSNEANLAGLYTKALDNSSCPYVANAGSCFSIGFTAYVSSGATTTSIPTDCPSTCDDNDIWTKDWFNLETQKCEHLFCQNKVDYEYKNGMWCKKLDSQQLPDLVAYSLLWKSQNATGYIGDYGEGKIYENKIVYFEVKVKNAGNVVPLQFVTLYLTVDNESIVTINADYIKPGEIKTAVNQTTYTSKFRWWNATKGEHEFKARINYGYFGGEDLPELSKDNNILIKKVVVD